MKIYHYTKCLSMNSIFTDGFIATEGKRGINKTAKSTDCAWLTEKTQFPKTALPFVSVLPETNLRMHLNQSIYIDLDKLSQFTGGIYRFGFDSNEKRFTKWKYSSERKAVENSIEWRRMESVANKVGDDIRSFWVSSSDILLTNFTLEEFSNGKWIIVLENCSFNDLTEEEEVRIIDIKSTSISMCEKYGIPTQHVRKAA